MAEVPARDLLRLLADGLALVYHEARNVRHLIKAGHLSKADWDQLLNLPTNKVRAWQAIQSVRTAAADAQTADKAAGQFSQRFGKDLADLQDLYANEHWRHAVGGHAWRGVTAAVMALRDAIEHHNIGQIESAAHLLLIARHNNGLVRDKIVELDAAVRVATAQWWRQPGGA